MGISIAETFVFAVDNLHVKVQYQLCWKPRSTWQVWCIFSILKINSKCLEKMKSSSLIKMNLMEMVLVIVPPPNILAARIHCKAGVANPRPARRYFVAPTLIWKFNVSAAREFYINGTLHCCVRSWTPLFFKSLIAVGEEDMMVLKTSLQLGREEGKSLISNASSHVYLPGL